jgi:hypothetical protein
MCLSYCSDNTGHYSSVSVGPFSCLFQAQQLLVSLLVLAKIATKLETEDLEDHKQF